MPWKFVCDRRFHEVLQTAIIRLITREKNVCLMIIVCKTSGKLRTLTNFHDIEYIKPSILFFVIIII